MSQDRPQEMVKPELFSDSTIDLTSMLLNAGDRRPLKKRNRDQEM
jgi:hypothetical protein